MTAYNSSPVLYVTNKKKTHATVYAAIGALLIGFLLGAYITVQIPYLFPTHTVVKLVKVDVTPNVCLKALTSADQGFTIAARMGGTFGDFVTAVQKRDSAGVAGVNTSLQNISSDLNDLTPTYTSNKEACQAAAH